MRRKAPRPVPVGISANTRCKQALSALVVALCGAVRSSQLTSDQASHIHAQMLFITSSREAVPIPHLLPMGALLAVSTCTAQPHIFRAKVKPSLKRRDGQCDGEFSEKDFRDASLSASQSEGNERDALESEYSFASNLEGKICQTKASVSGERSAPNGTYFANCFISWRDYAEKCCDSVRLDFISGVSISKV
ncbi:unnamed protein product [Litomosoides sigmodontis]|uniref:Uncharacterized protein n=1 Tax=Litomosoides sigmodontis TaxID=42156 RepID=A0A3P6U7A8_LITSI|nr:unnamed protein product [Litomosoides sigmodontis]